ncbi:MAG TPA: DUF305 domain-containing protein [Longimicrobiaceae bacterium]|nr:DUF305 domain-containing protein [Longimicrobiaceae bacterium]
MKSLSRWMSAPGLLALLAGPAQAQAPGHAHPADTPRAAQPRYTTADVAFMQGMIMHHAQALEMTALVSSRSRSEAVRLMAGRIEVSQRDETVLMQRWLRARGQAIPAAGMHGMPGMAMHGDSSNMHTMHADSSEMHTMREMHGDSSSMHGMAGMHDGMGGMRGGAMDGHALMPGMLTPEQMSRLAAANGDEFDRLFLAGMIQHHRGAITMVRALFATPGAGQEPELFDFASHVDADQRIEIARMQRLLDGMAPAARNR